MNGWIKLHRKFIDWEWFNKSEAVHLFLYLVLKANHKDSFWQGHEVKRGQFITSFGKISTDTNISLQTIRTLLKKFENTNEINIQTTNKFTTITICKYDSYQTENEETNTQLTNKQQTTNNQLTTNKNDKNNKEEYIPTLDDFINYAVLKISNINKDDVSLKYMSWLENDWSTNVNGKQRKIKNWKSTLLNTLPYIRKDEPKEDWKQDKVYLLAKAQGYVK
jgi:DNA-binding transcriptional MerR regulator